MVADQRERFLIIEVEKGIILLASCPGEKVSFGMVLKLCVCVNFLAKS